MLVGRLVTLIQEHADELAHRVVRKLHEDPRTPAYGQFDEDELSARVSRVYSHLGDWLGETTDDPIEAEYFALGQQRQREGVPLSEVVMALLLTRRNLWHFIEWQGADSNMLELRQQLDLEFLVVRFYDRAIHHTVRGYESAS